MKGKASGILKHVISLLASVVKSKSAALKSRTSAFKTRLIIFGLLHNKKVLMSAISSKIDALISGLQEKAAGGATSTADDGGNLLAIVQYHAAARNDARTPPECTKMAVSGGGEIAEEEVEEEDDDCYPDLRHSLFDEDDAADVELGGSVIDLVKNARGEDQGEFVLEDEIDRVAELFIERFHRQMRMQRLESFKRHPY